MARTTLRWFGAAARCALLVTLALTATTWGEETKDDKKEKYGTIIGIDLGTTYSW